jgi:hypothetical protein
MKLVVANRLNGIVTLIALTLATVAATAPIF